MAVSHRHITSSRRPRGRPKTRKKLQVHKAPVEIRPRPLSVDGPCLFANNHNHYSPVHQSVIDWGQVVDMQNSGWPFEDDPRTFQQYAPDPQLGGPSPQTQHSIAIQPFPMTRSHRRDWVQRIDAQLEEITKFCALDGEEGWVEFPRVLKSLRLDRSYIYEERLAQLKLPFTRCKTWEYPSPFGSLRAVGFVNFYVTTDLHSGHIPFMITAFVLPGSPHATGVDFMIGKFDLEAAYNGCWRSHWSTECPEQYVLNCTGRGHDTLSENNMFLSTLCHLSSH